MILKNIIQTSNKTSVMYNTTFLFWSVRSISLKTFMILLIILSVVGILRLNLATNDIAAQLSTSKETNLFEKAMTGVMYSDSVAEWQYIDLVVVKFACSERLKMTMVALPFKRWQSYDERRSICHNE